MNHEIDPALHGFGFILNVLTADLKLCLDRPDLVYGVFLVCGSRPWLGTLCRRWVEDGVATARQLGWPVACSWHATGGSRRGVTHVSEAAASSMVGRHCLVAGGRRGCWMSFPVARAAWIGFGLW